MANGLNDRRWLAAALMAYEADSPHVDLPDCEGSQHYPAIDPDYIDRAKSQKHCGDCNGQPQPCERCWADQFWHMAGWLIERAQHDS